MEGAYGSGAFFEASGQYVPLPAAAFPLSAASLSFASLPLLPDALAAFDDPPPPLPLLLSLPLSPLPSPPAPPPPPPAPLPPPLASCAIPGAPTVIDLLRNPGEFVIPMNPSSQMTVGAPITMKHG